MSQRLDVLSPSAPAVIPMYLEAQSYKKLHEELVRNFDIGTVLNHFLFWISLILGDSNEFQGILFLIVKSLLINYNREENKDRDELLIWCLKYWILSSLFKTSDE